MKKILVYQEIETNFRSRRQTECSPELNSSSFQFKCPSSHDQKIAVFTGKTNYRHSRKISLDIFFLHIIYSEKRAVFWELGSRKTARFSERIMSMHGQISESSRKVTDNVHEQISEHIFELNGGFLLYIWLYIKIVTVRSQNRNLVSKRNKAITYRELNCRILTMTIFFETKKY